VVRGRTRASLATDAYDFDRSRATVTSRTLREGVKLLVVSSFHALRLSALTRLAVCVLGLSACVRFGYDERRIPAADGGKVDVPDAAAPRDATGPLDAAAEADASAEPDAATTPDASDGRPDASAEPDAATAPDASMMSDAAATPDASAEPDAAVTPDSGSNCTPSVIRDYCTRLPALPQSPQLDGVLDCGPALIDLPASGWNSSGAMPSDNHARFAVAWRPDGLYLYVEVDDTLRLPALASDVDPWCGDGVELYADADGNYDSAPDYDDPGAMQLIATSPARDTSTQLAVDARYHTRSQVRVGDWAATRHVMLPRDSGYQLEAFVAAADLGLSSWSLVAGGKVGFDIAINVSVANETEKVDCGYGLGQYYLRLSSSPCNSNGCRPYSNAAAFCTALLE
jgi:hypothetical protein